MNKKPTTFRLSAELKPKLDELARSERRTVSSLISQAVEDFLARRNDSGTGDETTIDQSEPILSVVLKSGQASSFEELQAIGNESCSLLIKMFFQSDDDCRLELRTKDKTISFVKKAGKAEIEVPWHTWAKTEQTLRSVAQSTT